MLWLQSETPENLNLYLDIQQVEERQFRGRSFFAVSGICGDGLWEGEVLVEVGEEISVTFVDEWLQRQPPENLPAPLDRQPLAEALVKTLSGARFCLGNMPASTERSRRRILGCSAAGRWFPERPREWGEQLVLPLGVAEAGSSWEQRAA